MNILSTSLLAAGFVAVTLTGCSSGSSSSGGKKDNGGGDPQQVTTEGAVAKGLVLGGLVAAFPADENGAAAIATALTSIENGTYSLQLPEGTSGPVRLTVSQNPDGETQVICDAAQCADDVAFGDRYPMDFTLSSVISVKSDSVAISSPITPLTTLVDKHYQAQANPSVEGANAFVRDVFGLRRDPSQITPIDLTKSNPDTSLADLRDSLVVASFAGLAANGGLDDLLTSFSAGFATNTIAETALRDLRDEVFQVQNAIEENDINVGDLEMAASVAADNLEDSADAKCDDGVCTGDATPPPPVDNTNLDAAKAFVADLRGVVTQFQDDFLNPDNSANDSVQGRLDVANQIIDGLADNDEAFSELANSLGLTAVILAVHGVSGGEDGLTFLQVADRVAEIINGEGTAAEEAFDLPAEAFVGNVTVSDSGGVVSIADGELDGTPVSVTVTSQDFAVDVDFEADAESATVGPNFALIVNGEASKEDLGSLVVSDASFTLKFNRELTLDDDSTIADNDDLRLNELALSGELALTIAAAANESNEAGSFTGGFGLKFVRNESLADAIADHEASEAEEGDDAPILARSLLLVPSMLELSGEFAAGDTVFAGSLKATLSNVAAIEFPEADEGGNFDLVAIDKASPLLGSLVLSMTGKITPSLPEGKLEVTVERSGFAKGKLAIQFDLGDKSITLAMNLDSAVNDLDALADEAIPLLLVTDTRGVTMAIDLNNDSGEIVKDGAVLGTISSKRGVIFVDWADGSFETLI